MSETQRAAIRVIKVGGSLFDYDQLPAVLQSWLASQPPARNILLAGGGDLAEAIRAADRRYGLGEQASHRLCIHVMGATAAILARIVPESRVVTHAEAAASLSHSGPIVFDPAPRWSIDEPQAPGVALPQGWSVSSDSIAARLAEIVAADELVLLKSADPPQSPRCRAGDRRRQLEMLSEIGYVDVVFPQAASAVREIRFVNLRSK